MNALATIDPILPTQACRSPSLEGLALHSLLLSAVPREVARTMTAADVPALMSYLSEARRLARPVDETVAIQMLEALFLHYPQRSLKPEESAVIWADWCDDLADVPPDVLAAACRIWRRSSERFAPSPGQLLAKVGGSRHWGTERHVWLKRAADVLDIVRDRDVAA